MIALLIAASSLPSATDQFVGCYLVEHNAQLSDEGTMLRDFSGGACRLAIGIGIQHQLSRPRSARAFCPPENVSIDDLTERAASFYVSFYQRISARTGVPSDITGVEMSEAAMKVLWPCT